MLSFIFLLFIQRIVITFDCIISCRNINFFCIAIPRYTLNISFTIYFFDKFS